MIRRQFLASFVFTILFALTGFSETQILLIGIKDLHPTQANLGFKEVEKKAKKVAKKQANGELEQYLRMESVPVVLGPGNKKYMIDGHHFLAAAYKQKIEKVYYEVVDDYSNHADQSEFWKKMIDAKRVYLKDKGKPIEPSALPNDITGLTDDPYRTFAAEVRDRGGFNKTDTPFMEFVWADYFRPLVALDFIQSDHRKAIKQARTLARDSKAADLPGYRGPEK
ncbi:MAG: hypothetical protein B7Y39_15950 [Bdellovibrio sp. 28-41-41]|nr:MAG: hypothetical protein B7Y39_15950 [Bdellovibrio sp. 28-41-41]